MLLAFPVLAIDIQGFACAWMNNHGFDQRASYVCLCRKCIRRPYISTIWWWKVLNYDLRQHDIMFWPNKESGLISWRDHANTKLTPQHFSSPHELSQWAAISLNSLILLLERSGVSLKFCECIYDRKLTILRKKRTWFDQILPFQIYSNVVLYLD
jgi:hypothetical protein